MIQQGVLGFKAFLINSGVDEFPHCEAIDVEKAMIEFQQAQPQVVFMFHAELCGPIDHVADQIKSMDSKKYHTFLHSRPKQAENEAIQLVVRLSEKYQVRAHIVHLSSSDAVPMLREAQQKRVPISVETCTHYLHFDSEEIRDGMTQFKCCPPIREKDNREKLWKALEEGIISLVISDHSPADASVKCLDTGDFGKAWGGISSLQLRLSIMWTESKKRGYSLQQLIKWLCYEPAKLTGISERKGSIQVGGHADFVIWNPEESFTVSPELIHHRHKISPYIGETLYGVVKMTYVRGQLVFENGKFVGDKAKGQLILGVDKILSKL